MRTRDRTFRITLILTVLLGGAAGAADVRVEGARPAGDAVEVTLSWRGSWRTGAAHDGVWLAVKVRRGSTWSHARFAPGPDGYAVRDENGVPAAFTPVPDAAGVFVQREQDGRGDIDWRGLRLPLADGTLANADEVRVIPLEVVRVPHGAFDLGDGQSPGRFHAGGAPDRPYRVTEAPIALADAPGGLWADPTRSPLPSGTPGPAPWDAPSGMLPAAYPTGFEAFYVMKYEVTLGQYAEFLNTLPPNVAASYVATDADFQGGRACAPCGYDLRLDGGRYRTDQPDQAANWLTWRDATAFADWAGLRPMSELEFEKAARGSVNALGGEYAWGTTRIVAARAVGQDGRPTPVDANTHYSRTNIPQRPLNVGSFDGGGTREATGAGASRALDLSGNVVEMTVSAGNARGRAFIPNHGDGMLGPDGAANVPGWPLAPTAPAPQVPAGGWGFRGGDFWNPELDLRTSARNVATFAGARRLFGLGFRAVRTAP